jgi:hypothetical protein
MSSAFGAKIPPYAKVLELDRIVRNFPQPVSVLSTPAEYDNVSEAEVTADVHMQRWCITSSKEASPSLPILFWLSDLMFPGLQRCFIFTALILQKRCATNHRISERTDMPRLLQSHSIRRAG